MWAAIIDSLYGAEGGPCDELDLKYSSTWSTIILAGKEIDENGVNFSRCMKRAVGSGASIKVWKDRWPGD